MKFAIGETVKISRNHSLLFKAEGLPAKISNVITVYSGLTKQNYNNYEVIVDNKGTAMHLTVEEQELTRG
jgi:hypothetical protein